VNAHTSEHDVAGVQQRGRLDRRGTRRRIGPTRRDRDAQDVRSKNGSDDRIGATTQIEVRIKAGVEKSLIVAENHC